MNTSETRRRGRKVAMWLVAILLLVVGFAVFNRPGPAASTVGAQDPEMGESLVQGAPGSGPASSARDVKIEVIDEQTGLIVAIITADRMEPTDETNFTVTNPRVTRYLDGGQTVNIQSDMADAHIPPGQEQPDHGVMYGNVEIRLFDPVPQGTTVDVDHDRPTMTAELESLRFDSTLGQVSTESAIRIRGDEFEMQGVGMEWLMNAADSSLNSMRITRGRFARYVPLRKDGLRGLVRSPQDQSAEQSPSTPTPRPAGQPITTPEPSPAPAAPPPVTRMYRIDFVDNVVLTRGTHEAMADQLSVWVRTINNKLPEGAVPQITNTKKHTALTGVPFGPEMVRALAMFIPAAFQPESGQTETAPSVAEQPDASNEPIPAELRWTGPMIVTPIKEVPTQLAGGNHVFLRLFAGESGEVVMTDSETGSIARCAWVDYAVTTQVAVLGGHPDNGEFGVTLFAPDEENGDVTVRIATTSVDLEMGTFEVQGPGIAENTVEEQSIVWSRRATGDLVVADGKVVGVERALLEGAVRVSSVEGFASGDELDAFFDSSDGAVSIRRAVFTGRALAGNTRGESLESDWLEVIFEPGAALEGEQSRPVPQLVTARGDVVARQPDSITRGESLVAELESDGKNVVATRVEIDGGVTFERENEKAGRQTAHADRLIARPQRKVVDLFGTQDLPAQVTSKGTRIDGQEIRLDGDARMVQVFGPGHLTHADGDDPDGPTLLDLTWTIDMTFDDGGGIIDGRGDVRAIITTDDLSRDTIDAHRLRVVLVPADEAKARADALADAQVASSDDKNDDWSGMENRIRTFEAFGSVLYEDGGVDAIIRSRRYGPGGIDGTNARGPIIQAVDLSGARIIGKREIGDAAAGTLTVPGPGRLLVMDETPNTDETPAENETTNADETRTGPDGMGAAEGGSDSNGGRDMRGAALFDWDGSMTIDRGTGQFEMVENVRVSHKRSSDGSLLYVESDRIDGTATIAAETDGPVADPQDENKPGEKPPGDKMLGRNRIGDLREAIFSGNVYARWQGRELLADRVIYNAELGTIRAEADANSRLTIVESARAAVVHAMVATWDMETGEAQLEGVRPIVVPVGPLPDDGKK